jgi:GR25 family glycosyltransferase involved in LPS biosynthesis
MIVHVINLDRSAERLQSFHRANRHLSRVSRFAAVDGRQLDVAALIASGVVERPMIDCYTVGALGNALSHLALWRQAIDADAVMTICEDDAVFNYRWEQQAPQIISRLPVDWDIVLWGWNLDAALGLDIGASSCVVFSDEDRLARDVEKFQLSSIDANPIPMLLAFGVLGYSISPKGAHALREFCLPIRELSVSLPWPEPGAKTLKTRGRVQNTAISVMMAVAYPQLRAFVSFPPLIVSKNEQHTSTVSREVLLRDLLINEA